VKTRRQCTTYYFYVLDGDFGPGFIKIISYFPYPAKVWLNGPRMGEAPGRSCRPPLFRARQRLRRLRRAPPPASHRRPARSHDIQAFFEHWMTVIPTPLTTADREAGFWWSCPCARSRLHTLVFDDPRRARAFFEALVADNVGIGRPGEVAMVFSRPLRRPTKHIYRQRVFGTGTEVRMDFSYKHSRVKQYLKEGRALRIETVINDRGTSTSPAASSIFRA